MTIFKHQIKADINQEKQLKITFAVRHFGVYLKNRHIAQFLLNIKTKFFKRNLAKLALCGNEIFTPINGTFTTGWPKFLRSSMNNLQGALFLTSRKAAFELQR